MKMLVTGAGGQVARSLVEAARARPIEIIALGRPILDITDRETIDARVREIRPDLVVNAAAYTAVDMAEVEPDAAHMVNALGALNVARAAREAGVPLIHISTDYVFDGAKQAPYIEMDRTAPGCVYGRTKLEGELAVAKACPHHLILRTAWVHSPHGKNFVKTMLRLAETRSEIGVVDDQKGSPTYAPHLAEAIIQIAAAISARRPKEIPWGVYHAAGRGETTWCGLARSVFERSAALGGPLADARAIFAADYPTPARRPANSRLDVSRLEDAFGVALPAWQIGVAECVVRVLAARIQQ